MARHGASNGFWNKRHSEETRHKISVAGKGRKMSEETKRKISVANKGINSYMFGKPKSTEIRKKLSEANIGKHASIETRKKQSEAQKGEKGSNWRGGVSFEIYPQDWTETLKESIRQRDDYICQECGIHQEELIEKPLKLDVHHIDYNKKNCDPDNLLSLCRKCHVKTNYNRKYWSEYFKIYE